MCHSKIDHQEKLAHKIAEWLQESPQDKFFLRPSMKSTSEVFETAQEGGVVRGVRILQNCTGIRINTAQNNIRKPQTALKLPEISKYRKLLGFVKLH